MSHSDLPKDQHTWDPPENERVWYEHCHTGDRGFLVIRQGKPAIRYNRPSEDKWIPFRKNDWKPMRKHRPLRAFDLGRIAYDADQVAKFVLGQRQGRVEPWHGLRPEVRAEWMNGYGPGDKAHPMRKALFISILKALQPYTE